MSLSAELSGKSVQAAVAAIEVYNKPNFSYREEAFSLLIVNAWELLLKAKWALDHGEAIDIAGHLENVACAQGPVFGAATASGAEPHAPS